MSRPGKYYIQRKLKACSKTRAQLTKSHEQLISIDLVRKIVSTNLPARLTLNFPHISYRLVPKVQITPIEINLPEEPQYVGPFDRSYLSPEPFEMAKKQDEIDPFSHTMSPGICDILKIFIMTFTIAPIRFALIIQMLFLAWFVSKVGLIGLSKDQLNECPIDGWRCKLQTWVRKILRAMFFCMGMHKIEVFGKQVIVNSKNLPAPGPGPGR